MHRKHDVAKYILNKSVKVKFLEGMRHKSGEQITTGCYSW